jgi:methanogenic corrinoid protein MtbC1
MHDALCNGLKDEVDLEALERQQADILGMSALLTTTMP